jgi:hypothetical protein
MTRSWLLEVAKQSMSLSERYTYNHYSAQLWAQTALSEGMVRYLDFQWFLTAQPCWRASRAQITQMFHVEHSRASSCPEDVGGAR